MLVGTLASTLGYVGVISKLDAPVLKPEAADSLKVGLPILNMGLPKSGDTTLLDMGLREGVRAALWDHPAPGNQPICGCGVHRLQRYLHTRRALYRVEHLPWDHHRPARAFVRSRVAHL